MKFISKALVGTIAAGAMAVTATAPAQAQWRDRDRDRHHGDGVDAGDIIAGALIIGGIAAVASAASNGRYDRYDRYDRGYNRAGSPRQAVEQCVYAAERNASGYSRRGGAQVTDIRNIERNRDGYTVRGRIAVDTNNRDWRRGWGNDYRGWNDNYRGYDAGRFTCDVRYGRVVDLDYSGIRGLR